MGMYQKLKNLHYDYVVVLFSLSLSVSLSLLYWGCETTACAVNTYFTVGHLI